VQIVLACLDHQFHALKIRCSAYEQQLATMNQQAIQIEDLKHCAVRPMVPRLQHHLMQEAVKLNGNPY
jgi:hypothetical protein